MDLQVLQPVVFTVLVSSKIAEFRIAEVDISMIFWVLRVHCQCISFAHIYPELNPDYLRVAMFNVLLVSKEF